MLKKYLLPVLLFLAPALLFSQQALIRELTGTVELKHAGQERWDIAVPGQNIAAHTVISTGFKSTALLAVGSSILHVRPLTRLTLAEIHSSAQTETINVALQAGRMKADIKAPAGSKASFTAQTPTTTASVRGTVFELDTVTITVLEGSVEFTGASGASVVVDAGRQSYFDESSGRPALPEETLISDLRPDTPLGSDFAGAVGDSGRQISDLELIAIIEY